MTFVLWEGKAKYDSDDNGGWGPSKNPKIRIT